MTSLTMTLTISLTTSLIKSFPQTLTGTSKQGGPLGYEDPRKRGSRLRSGASAPDRLAS